MSAKFSKTISETDIYLFAGISGDFHPFHIDETYARQNGQKGRIAHGVIMLALLSTVSTLVDGNYSGPTVSYGYDRVRFIKPVFIGDTITAEYKISEIDKQKEISYAECICTNQNGELVMAARHLNKFLW